MAFVLSEDSGEEVAFRLNTDNGIKLYMDTECSFSLFPLSEVSEYIVYRWPHQSVYTEAFGAREGGGVICNERAIIEVRIPLAAGHESVVRLVGNLTDHPGAKHMLLLTPQICRLSGYAAIVTSNRDIVKAKLTSASPSADFPFTTSVLAQRCRPSSSRAGKDLFPFVNEWNLTHGAFKLLRCDNEKGIVKGDVRAVLDRVGTVVRPFASHSSRGPMEKWWTVLRSGMASLVATWGLPLGFVPLLCLCIEWAYNRTATYRKASPLRLSTGKVPDISLMPGDPIVFSPSE
uniref:Uncharacterized protein n=1 Tax=Chromera velia CCMP2878 TaxID=1169474 RepID=A0A0G4I2J4_9ALVE|eukprot:Cvel_10417.t1-p1 / transcript=Cvel_10417.t1 / gene=Cvel_10417 / organism=Chromera_velia_CCMP2878 / gene_product=hypothetical protein / transcript_product=hypothetical protein / location=Cvel_scaffold628:11605-13151(-) / protein_length=288 / sequence_SO=supercontig / SO=protein_coding / is_pseudo=false